MKVVEIKAPIRAKLISRIVIGKSLGAAIGTERSNAMAMAVNVDIRSLVRFMAIEVRKGNERGEGATQNRRRCLAMYLMNNELIC
mmetsp:Transcript_22693/g.47812  ORF Transcript_22693/g.47812 Transcript_22693/m.47812 type:complete len:85 (+) Transcript_22693:56-310(+)